MRGKKSGKKKKKKGRESDERQECQGKYRKRLPKNLKNRTEEGARGQKRVRHSQDTC